jgi:hypothetical protein
MTVVARASSNLPVAAAIVVGSHESEVGIGGQQVSAVLLTAAT